MDTKTCKACGLDKPVDEFYKSRKRKDGTQTYQTKCKVCHSSYAKNWKEENPERAKEHQSNPEAKAKRKEYNSTPEAKAKRKEYKSTPEYKARRNELRKERRKTDPLYAMTERVRRRIHKALSRLDARKNYSTIDYLGISSAEYVKYIESKFDDGMCWSNKGDWHIDHIVPLASARNEKELSKLFHYSNTQPMWATDNLKKGSKLD